MAIKFKADKYKRARGGYSRLLSLGCQKCGTHLFYYQKDGPGMLKRLYLDRIYKTSKKDSSAKPSNSKVGPLICPKCKEIIGIPIIYKKESRSAYRLFAGAVEKKIVSSASI